MYLSINFNTPNLYLYQKNTGPTICKNNFAYKITSNEHYNKITSIISNLDSRDIVQIFDNDKIKLMINPIWCLKKFSKLSLDSGVKKNILLPNINDLDLFNENIDLNSINCLCHDNTYITAIPNITLTINNTEYIFVEWTGNNQIWCSAIEDEIFYTYAYIYIFSHRSILLISQTPKEIDHHHYFDLDLISYFDHKNLIEDEYNRIDCHNYYPNFSSISILNNPPNRSLDNSIIKIQTDSNVLLPN